MLDTDYRKQPAVQAPVQAVEGIPVGQESNKEKKGFLKKVFGGKSKKKQLLLAWLLRARRPIIDFYLDESNYLYSNYLKIYHPNFFIAGLKSSPTTLPERNCFKEWIRVQVLGTVL